MNDRTNGAPEPGARPIPEGERGGEPQRRQRPLTRAEERIAALDTSGAAEAAEIESLREQLAAATAAAEEAKAGWQRSMADFANYKRRNEQERAERSGLANDALLLKVVAIADDLDLAIEHVPADAQGSPWVEGIAAIDRKLRGLLDSEGVTPIESEGKPFDPHEQQAVSYEETAEAPDGTVLKELQRGYRIRDRVLRPALVAVARNDDDTHAQQQEQE